MIYPIDFESKVGFDTVRSVITEKCISPMGRRQVEQMSFLTEKNEIIAKLRCVDEMASILRREAQLPIDNLHDISPAVTAIRAQGSFLTAEQLQRIKGMLITLAEIRGILCRTEDAGDDQANPVYPSLNNEFYNVETHPDIVSLIDRVLDKFGEVKDTASPRLAEIRRELAGAQSAQSRIMRSILSKAIADGVVDADTAPAVRDGRLVIPVPAMMKRRIPGIVHDESATGKTSFIEPSAVVEAGNRLRELRIEEHREIVVILTNVTSEIRPHADSLLECSDRVGVYDFIRAKALFAIDVDAQMPVIADRPEIEWYHAVHPVLLITLRKHGQTPVPLDIRFDKGVRFVIISGPNAGGKSVCLKTVGIVQYMTQCGVLPTVRSNSHVGLFKNLYIDIGDEQSIDNDLSTYSSHLRNMKYFLRGANKRTLVLADEMGSGTEPQIGGALAQAILSKLGKSGCMGIVTTHYQNLKSFADDTEGFVNAAMLYDRQKLQPLFQLHIGSPGSSFALEIARKSGLPNDVIDAAQEIVGSDYVNIDKYLLDIVRDRSYWASKRAAIKAKEQKVDEALSRYEEKATQLREQRSDIIADARRQAKEILSGVNARVERTIHEIKKAEAEKEQTRKIRRELDEYRQEVDRQANNDAEVPSILKDTKSAKHKKNQRKEIKPAAANSAGPIEVGNYVRMSEGGVVGKVLAIEGKKAQVAFGALRTTVDLSKLRHAAKPKETAASQQLSIGATTSSDSRKRQLNFSTELDVRGMRADEAMQAVTYFLDDALQFNSGRVRILHGTGNGILRTVIRQLLQSNPAVVSFHDEDVRFGGAGITVVNLS